MRYINTLNEEQKTYLRILAGKQLVSYLRIIKDYIDTETLQRLRGKGQFCGNDYQNIPIIKPKYWYTSLNHSVNDGAIVFHLTEDPTQALAGLFHDRNTASFKHSGDFRMGDYENQESSESFMAELIFKDKKLLRLLKRDNIKLEDILNIQQYPIVENERPNVCADRLEGIFHTGLVWIKFWELDDINEIYKKITILENEHNKSEIGITDLSAAEFFTEGAYNYSIVLQQNEDKLALQMMADIQTLAIHYGVVYPEELWLLSETQIIDKIEKSGCEDLIDIWHFYNSMTEIHRSDIAPKNDCYTISIDNVRKRYVDILCKTGDTTKRISKISLRAGELLKKYFEYKDSAYAYVDYTGIALPMIKKLSKMSHSNL